MKSRHRITIDGIAVEFVGCYDCPMNQCGCCQHPAAGARVWTGGGVVRAGEVAPECPAKILEDKQ